MTAKQPKRGRPVGVRRYTVQEHVFLDLQLAAKLARLAKLAGIGKSEYIRRLIQAQE